MLILKDMQVILLSGGKGTRMRELTETIPKPMVEVGGKPVLSHLMSIFNKFKDFEFIIATGYKSEIIENYFKEEINVKTVFTGEDTNTGGRVKKLEGIIDGDFIVTYGDGLANVNIENLIKFHNSHKKNATITVTNPISRFGLVEFDEKNKFVNKFIEKPKLEGFINIGFFVFKKEIFNYLNEDSTLETTPLVELVKKNQLVAYHHDGYFEPMDTYREYLQLNEYWDSGNPPWLNF